MDNNKYGEHDFVGLGKWKKRQGIVELILELLPMTDCCLMPNGLVFDLVYDVSRHFQQYCSYIVAVSFIGVGQRQISDFPSMSWRKQATFNRMMISFALYCNSIVKQYWNNNPVGRHVAPLGHIILSPSLLVFTLTS